MSKDQVEKDQARKNLEDATGKFTDAVKKVAEIEGNGTHTSSTSTHSETTHHSVSTHNGAITHEEHWTKVTGDGTPQDPSSN